MWTRLVGMLVTAAGAAMAFGCSHPRLEVPAAVVEDKVSTATPASGPPTAGIVTGEVADIKVTERDSRRAAASSLRPNLPGSFS